MGRLIFLELKKVSKPVLISLVVFTALACILSCTVFQAYTLIYNIDKWEIGTEYISLLFPLFVTVPVCWQLYYERRDRFLFYALIRASKRQYIMAKWIACALSAFALLFVQYFLSALCALYLSPCKELHPDYAPGFNHVLFSLYTQRPLVYAFLLSGWKGFLGVLTMTLGFALALFNNNIFVVLTAPFIYVELENFTLSVCNIPWLRLVTAFEPSVIDVEFITAATFYTGPLLLCAVIGIIVLYYIKLKGRSIYPI